ncbi:oligosaccharide flippase family protein [Prosthecochloris sp.]|uniref:oligosaccharide flippase family protein n=1 Tax=Prosthecochloris sp. TaxID=290513 RepID=UPI00257CE2CD|nr:oligosaccharide flippase family protein [Prosthecochloris sp.]
MQFPRLRYNIIALGAVRGVNYLIPVMVIPYLTRVLGADAFGVYTLVQVVMQVFILLTNYGFFLTATRAISANRADYLAVSRIFSTTWCTQLLLGGISFLCLLVLMLTLPVIKEHALIYLGGFTMVLGNVLFPVWFLEGLERMRAIAVLQIVGRLLVLPLLFVFVKGAEDTFWAITIMGVGLVCAGLLSLFWIIYKKLVIWQIPTRDHILKTLKEGFSLFLSQLSQRMFFIVTPFALSFLSGMTAVGYFNLADKLRGAAQALLHPVSQALFPRMCHLYVHDKVAADDLLKRSFLLILFLGFSVSLLLWAGADLIIQLFAGQEFEAAASVLRWMSAVPLLSVFSLVFGIQIMLPNGMNRPYNLIVSGVSCLSIVFMFFLVRYIDVNGAALATVVLELLMAFMLGWFVISKGFLKWQYKKHKDI